MTYEHLIPAPCTLRRVPAASGFVLDETGFVLDETTVIDAGPGAEATARWLRGTIGAATGLAPPGAGDAGETIRRRVVPEVARPRSRGPPVVRQRGRRHPPRGRPGRRVPGRAEPASTARPPKPSGASRSHPAGSGRYRVPTSPNGTSALVVDLLVTSVARASVSLSFVWSILLVTSVARVSVSSSLVWSILLVTSEARASVSSPEHPDSDGSMPIGYVRGLEDVDRFEPVTAELTRDEARHILGAQENV